MLILNPRDGRPVYQQVKDGLRLMVTSGAVADGETMPGPADLSVKLAVNPSAIRRAYDELEAEGYVRFLESGEVLAAHPGGGNSGPGGLLHQLDRLVTELLMMGMTIPQLTERIEGVRSSK